MRAKGTLRRNDCKQGLRAGHRFITILAVAQHAGEGGNLGDPATAFSCPLDGNVRFRLASTNSLASWSASLGEGGDKGDGARGTSTPVVNRGKWRGK
jgi:hypothetical protein